MSWKTSTKIILTQASLCSHLAAGSHNQGTPPPPPPSLCPFIPPTLTKTYLHTWSKSHSHPSVTGHRSLVSSWQGCWAGRGGEGEGWQRGRGGGMGVVGKGAALWCFQSIPLQGREAPDAPERQGSQADAVDQPGRPVPERQAKKVPEGNGPRRAVWLQGQRRSVVPITVPIFIFWDFLHHELLGSAASHSPMGHWRQNPGAWHRFGGGGRLADLEDEDTGATQERVQPRLRTGDLEVFHPPRPPPETGSQPPEHPFPEPCSG